MWQATPSAAGTDITLPGQQESLWLPAVLGAGLQKCRQRSEGRVTRLVRDGPREEEGQKGVGWRGLLVEP